MSCRWLLKSQDDDKTQCVPDDMYCEVLKTIYSVTKITQYKCRTKFINNKAEESDDYHDNSLSPPVVFGNAPKTATATEEANRPPFSISVLGAEQQVVKIIS